MHPKTAPKKEEVQVSVFLIIFFSSMISEKDNCDNEMYFLNNYYVSRVVLDCNITDQGPLFDEQCFNV